MVRISFVFLESLFTAAWLALRLIVWAKQKRIDWKREALLLLLYVDLAVILRFTFFPLKRVDGMVQPLIFNAGKVFPLKVNLIPFVKLFVYVRRRQLALNVLGNVALFVPNGILLPILYKKLKGVWKTVGVCAMGSLAIELLQLPFYVRTSDIDDLILNTLGAVLGYGIYALAREKP